MKIGRKASQLKKLSEVYPDNVPPFEVIPFAKIIKSYDSVVKDCQQLIEKTLHKKIDSKTYETKLKLITNSLSLNNDALREYHAKITTHHWNRVSFRTSALSEDAENASFAGQYESFVDVEYSYANLKSHALKCFKSLFSQRVAFYALAQNMKSLEIGGALIVQEMFYGTSSGVVFTENGRGEITVKAVDSWQNTVVEGSDASTYNFSKRERIPYHRKSSPSKIARMALELEQIYQHPLDIEWAYSRRKCMLLQVRPQTVPTVNYSLTWDGTNISENYPGISLPLTYSFIRRLYAEVYPSFFRIMGMRKKTLEKNAWIFDHALGYVNGRIYYRIDNWYELVSLIPGKRNQIFFEAMLNPARKRKLQDNSTKIRTLLDPGFLVLSLRFIWILLRSQSYSMSFKKNISEKIEIYSQLNWSNMTAEASLDHLRSIRRELLVMWGVPILNDVRVMIYHGIFKTTLMKNTDKETYLSNLQGLVDQASIKPLQELHDLGKEIDKAMEHEDVEQPLELEGTQSWKKTEEAVQSFIKRYGGRTPDELKLENPRLGEDIWGIIALAYASKDAQFSARKRKPAPRFTQFSPLKRLFARYIAHNTRQAIDNRERFRFNRAQVFGIARIAYLAIGEKFFSAGVIAEQGDIFWLTEEEIEAIINGHNWNYNYQKTIALRKSEYREYEKMPFWLRVHGEGDIAPAEPKDATPQPDSESASASGSGVSPGTVTAPAIVVEKFDPNLDVSNKILVVKHIDPGWTLLLVQAIGVITEQGNALSHVAIVSREINTPAIVGVKNAVSKIHTGDRIAMNGTTGEIINESS